MTNELFKGIAAKFSPANDEKTAEEYLAVNGFADIAGIPQTIDQNGKTIVNPAFAGMLAKKKALMREVFVAQFSTSQQTETENSAE